MNGAEGLREHGDSTGEPPAFCAWGTGFEGGEKTEAAPCGDGPPQRLGNRNATVHEHLQQVTLRSRGESVGVVAGLTSHDGTALAAIVYELNGHRAGGGPPTGQGPDAADGCPIKDRANPRLPVR
jgi:hypothetical protein